MQRSAFQPLKSHCPGPAAETVQRFVCGERRGVLARDAECLRRIIRLARVLMTTSCFTADANLPESMGFKEPPNSSTLGKDSALVRAEAR